MKHEPEFTHDCEECTPLGTVRRSEMILVTDEVADALTNHIENATVADLVRELGQKAPEVWDLYFCSKRPSLGGSIIARYGHEGPEYKSAPIGYAQVDTELKLGFDLASRSALIPNCGVSEG